MSKTEIPTYTVTKQFDVTDESIDRIAEAVAKKIIEKEASRVLNIKINCEEKDHDG